MSNRFPDRIIETRKIKARDLTDHAGNWRVHPLSQREAVEGILKEVGKAGVMMAWHSERAGGKLTLFDGHLRKSIDPDEEWTVAITDLTDSEADKMAVLMDPLSSLAETDGGNLLALLETTTTDDVALRELLRQLENTASHADRPEEKDEPGNEEEENLGPPAMELMPFEHYDYIMLMFRNEMDWVAAQDVFGLERRSDPRKTGKVGLCRVLDGRKVVDRLSQAEFKVASADSHSKPKTG